MEMILRSLLVNLPAEMLVHTLKKLSPEDLARVSAVCKDLNQLALDAALTRALHSNDDVTNIGSVRRASYVARFEWTVNRLEDASYSGRRDALERLRKLPVPVLERYAGAVVLIMRLDEDVNVQMTAVETVYQLDGNVLEPYKEEFKTMITLENQIHGINKVVLKVLCKIDPSIVVDYMVNHDDAEIKLTALWTLRTLDASVLVRYRNEIFGMLTVTDPYEHDAMLGTAMWILCQIDPNIVADICFGDTIVTMHMKWLALHALSKIKPVLLEPYASRLVEMLDDADRDIVLIVFDSLKNLDSNVLAQYANTLAEKLKHPDTNWAVRERIIKTLGNLEPTVLKNHAKIIATHLDDASPVVIDSALQTLNRLDFDDLIKYKKRIAKLEMGYTHQNQRARNIIRRLDDEVTKRNLIATMTRHRKVDRGHTSSDI